MSEWQELEESGSRKLDAHRGQRHELAVVAYSLTTISVRVLLSLMWSSVSPQDGPFGIKRY